MSRTALGLGLLVALGCGAGDRFPTASITVGDQHIEVELAVDAEHRALGLMHRDSLPADRGMLFVYANDDVRSFWMKNTRIPLSIAFADRDGDIVRIADMRPLDTSSTSSLSPARYALEMNQGWFAAHGVKVGDRLRDLPDVEVR